MGTPEDPADLQLGERGRSVLLAGIYGIRDTCRGESEIHEHEVEELLGLFFFPFTIRTYAIH